MLSTALVTLLGALVLCASFASSQENCTDQSLCRECLQLPYCAWCPDQTVPDFSSRCMARNSSAQCSDLQDPRGSLLQTTLPDQAVEVSPVRVKLDLRVGEPQTFRIQVNSSANYPLDLYILMDLSGSMANDLVTLQSLSNSLANTLSNVTTDFHIGFGSFNEKPTIPFIDSAFFAVNPTNYSYKHIVSLTNDLSLFRSQIDELSVSSNIDLPEAMLEGLLQTVVCRDVVGWRERARRLVLVLTDADYHLTGDGKLAGIIQPHDGQCYVPVQRAEETVYYEAWDIFDYPSIAQVNAKLRENEIVPIFAVTNLRQSVYEKLIPEMEGAILETLSPDSSNLLEIIQDSYRTTTQRVELLPTLSPGVSFSIEPHCGSATSIAGRGCEGLQVGGSVAFTVAVTLLSCSAELRRGDTKLMDILIPGFGRVEVEISGICSCPCENNTVLNSSECSGNGDLSCGVCECLDGWFGDQCRCESLEATTAQCPTNNNVECSGRGTCICGRCLCTSPLLIDSVSGVQTSMIYGNSCECDNINCLTGSGICNDRGECVGCNGMCSCFESLVSGQQYLGNKCECLPIEEACISNGSSLVCGGHGSCGCNRCTCEEGFGGTFCEVSTVQPVVSCDGEECVRCVAEVEAGSCDVLNCSLNVQLIAPVVVLDYTIEGMLTAECFYNDAAGCVHVYYTNGMTIHVEDVRMCSLLPIPIWALVLVIVGGLVVLAVMLGVLIKIIVVILDRREYKRFLSEITQADFSEMENPLYHNPKTTVKNVTYKHSFLFKKRHATYVVRNPRAT